MNEIPTYISLSFLSCVIAAFGFIYFAVSHASHKESNAPLVVSTFFVVWIFLISLLTFMDFFQTGEYPVSKLLVLMILACAVALLLVALPKTKRYVINMPIATLTYIHIIRVPIEIILWWLFTLGVVTEAMTFEGFNYDILSGISAPFAGLFFVGMKSKSNFAAIVWNILALGLLFNLVFRAFSSISANTHLIANQQSFGLFLFPYILLPLFMIPILFFCHITALYQLLFIKTKDEY